MATTAVVVVVVVMVVVVVVPLSIPAMLLVWGTRNVETSSSLLPSKCGQP
jgi:hypothetical protein